MRTDSAEAPVRPFSWSTERYLAMVEAGIIPEGREIELVAPWRQ